VGTPSTDPRVYRVQIDSNIPGAPDLVTPQIRLIKREALGNDLDVPYNFVFDCKNQSSWVTTGPAPFRMCEEIRLVSNADRGQSVLSGGVYDDQPGLPMADKQTVCVELGDRIRAELTIAGSYATSIELPVNTPPLGLDADNSIQTALVRWTLISAGASPVPDLATRRQREDLAQVGIRSEVNSLTTTTLFKNMLVVTSAGGPVAGNGTVTYTIGAGQPLTVPFSYSTNGTAADNARAIGESITAALPGTVPADKRQTHWNGSVKAWLIVMKPGTPVAYTATPGNPQVQVYQWDGNWGQQMYQEPDVIMWAMNFKDETVYDENAKLASGSETVELFILPSGWRYQWDLTHLADTWTWEQVYEDNNPASQGVTVTTVDAVDSNDSPVYWSVLGHELGHALLKSRDHAPGQTNLMFESVPQTAENPTTSPKRLPDTGGNFSGIRMRAMSAKSRMPALLFEKCPQ
jgi:hypothetical protein